VTTEFEDLDTQVGRIVASTLPSLSPRQHEAVKDMLDGTDPIIVDAPTVPPAKGTTYSPEYIANNGWRHGYDAVVPTKNCRHCHGTGRGPGGDPDTDCGFCE